MNSSGETPAASILTLEDEDDERTFEETYHSQQLAVVTPEKLPSCISTSQGSSSSLTVSHLEEMGLIDVALEWIDAMGGVVHSSEFQRLVHSSGQFMLSAGGAAVRTACLPVTLPLHVAHHTTCFLVEHCLVQPLVGVTQLLLQPDFEPRTITQEEAQEGNEPHRNPIAAAAHGVWCLPGNVAGLANHLKDEMGGMVLRTLTPPRPANRNGVSPRAGESRAKTTDPEKALERLRLDYGFPAEAVGSKAQMPVKTSHVLLRIDDLRVADETANNSSVYYIDLNALEDPLVSRSLERMVHIGLSLLASHPTVRISHQPNVVARAQEIEWKSEGNTPRLLRKLSKLDEVGRLETLYKETLVWSGRFKHDVRSGYDRQSRFFLARGVINMSPRTLLKLLWDNSRTSEYNKFCLGRTTLAGNDTRFLQGLDKTGTKIIQSETRVPMTSISVSIKCVMHARALPDNTGYIIVSRSCVSGPGGVHHEALKDVSRPKNEIHWGVNILRRVAHREDLVDLTSTSQVGTAGVPQFLAAKIALVGVEGFFENARKLAGP